MEIEKVIFVIMLLVGIVALVLTVSLIVKEYHKETFSFEMNPNRVNYPVSSAGNQVLLSSQVNVRNYCSR